MRHIQFSRGFTIVELLIVIVVIAILAAISVVAYNGIQQRSRDSRREQDIASTKKLLLAYNAINGGVRVTTTYGGSDSGGWDSSATGVWLTFLNTEPGSAPIDPLNNLTGDPGDGTSLAGYGYWYYCYAAGSGPNPATANVRLGYRSERTGARVHTDFPVQSCF